MALLLLIKHTVKLKARIVVHVPWQSYGTLPAITQCYLIAYIYIYSDPLLLTMDTALQKIWNENWCHSVGISKTWEIDKKLFICGKFVNRQNCSGARCETVRRRRKDAKLLSALALKTLRGGVGEICCQWINKKAVLSQRWPRNAPYIRVP